MPRRAIVRPAIIKALEDSRQPLRFSELKTEVKRLLNRNHLDDKQLYYNLQKLLNHRAVEKIIFEGRAAYRLTSSYYEEDLTRTLVEILNKRRPSEVYADLTDSKSASHIVYVVPPAYDYETKRSIDEADMFDEPEAFGGGPMKRAGESRYIPKWEHPCSAVSSVMLNDFNGLLNIKERRGITELLRWAYWAGCRVSIDEDAVYLHPLHEIIEKNKMFALKCIDKFKENPRRVAVERALLSILDLTKGLIAKNNLADFLSYLYGHEDEHNLLLKRISTLEQEFLGGGEKIFNDFRDIHSKVVLGLMKAGLFIDRKPLFLRSYRERMFLMFGDIWNDFMKSVIIREKIFALSSLSKDKDLRNVCGSLEEATSNVLELRSFLEPLLSLPLRRRIAIIYLWGFPQVLALSRKEFIPEFESWIKALEKGYLDHEPWIFDEGKQSVIRTIRAIKRGRSPPPLLLDLQRWTTRDVWEIHPHGKEPEFWQRILTIMDARAERLQNYSR